MADRVRMSALQALGEALRKEEFAKEAVDAASKGLEPRDRGFLRELVYGVLENRMYLDHMLRKLSKRPLHALDRDVLNVLRMGLYEMLVLGTPAHAAINEAVECIRKKRPAAKGFVNGLLRNADRRRGEIAEVDTGDPLRDLSIRTSHPLWIVRRIFEYFGPEDARGILEKDNTPAPTGIFMVSTQDADTLIRELGEELGCEVKKSAVAERGLVAYGKNVAGTRAFREGRISIQSQPSLYAAERTADPEAKRVLDLCAAPGSKTAALAVLMPEAEITANDVSKEKTDKIRENAKRLGLENVVCSEHDAAVFYPEWEEAFDAVLVDAPCSGLGLLRRKPDIRWNRDAEDIDSLAEIQRAIVKNAVRYVKRGGRIVYSTCTYGRKENEDVAEIIARTPGFIPEPGKETKRFNPLIEDCDGFFVASFRRE